MSLSASVPVIAAFDFDGTLTRRDTLLPFLRRGLGWPRFLWAVLRCLPWLAAYALRLVPNHVAKARLLRATLSGRTTAEIQAWTTRWMTNDFPGQLRPWSMERLAFHQQAKHCCVMVSASPDIYLLQVAQQLGFDALICTELEVVSGCLTGVMRTPNCHGEQKVLRLKAWMAERFALRAAGGWTLYAYGDSACDRPMLRLADEAWYRSKPWRE